MVFFNACLAIHEKRIDDNRHFCTCQPVQTFEEAKAEGRTKCFLCCCTRREPDDIKDNSSGIETLTRSFLSRIVLTIWAKIVIILLCIAFVIVSVWLLCSYVFTSDFVNIFKPEFISKQSYYSNFYQVESKAFTSDFFVTFTVHGRYVLSDDTSTVRSQISNIPYIENSSEMFWYASFKLDPYFNNSKILNKTVLSAFLNKYPHFSDDVTFDEDGSLLYYRFYFKTIDIRTSNDVIRLKENILKISSISESSWCLDRTKSKSKSKPFVAVYSPNFLLTDRKMRPIIEYFIMVGVQFVCCFCLVSVICSHLLASVHFVVWFTTVHVGMFAGMALLGLTMNPVTMIAAVLGSCYSIDVLVHSIISFSKQVGLDRRSRASDVMSSVSVILFNTSLAGCVGLLVIFLENSYVFISVMKVLLICTSVCFLHCGFFIPIGLSFFGPRDENIPDKNSMTCINLGISSSYPSLVGDKETNTKSSMYFNTSPVNGCNNLAYM